MKAKTTWLAEQEKSRIADQAIDLLASVGMRFAGSKVLPLLAERGAEVDEATGIARLPRELVEWALAQCPRSFVMAGATPADDVVLGEGEPFHFAPERVRGQDAGLPHRGPPAQHARGPARVHRPHGRAAGARPDVDAGERHRRAARAARARGVLHDAHRDVQARDVRRLSQRGRRGHPHLRGAVRRPRQLPRAAAHLHGRHRGLAAPGGGPGARHPRRAGRPRRTHRGLLDDDRRGDLARDPGRHRRPGPGGVPRRRHRPAGRGAGGEAGLLLRLRRPRHAAHDLLAGLRGERPHGRDGHRGGPLPRRPHPQPRAVHRQQASRAADRLRKGAQGRERVRREPRHRLRLGPDRLPQHHVPPAVRGRQRDRRHGAAPPRRGRDLRGHAGRRVHRQGRARRRLPRREGHGAAHPRRRAPAADRLEPALLRQVGRRGPRRRTTWRTTRSSGSSRPAPRRSPT